MVRQNIRIPGSRNKQQRLLPHGKQEAENEKRLGASRIFKGTLYPSRDFFLLTGPHLLKYPELPKITLNIV
jgi:hypothetical protein